jgi:ATP-binding cassette subfamily F protein 3
VFIAGALLDKPEVLLLDEPTNHLDISSIQWLEEFLQKEYEGSLVLVTHDVALQRRTTDALAILHGGRFYFRTHQSDYLTFRESLGDEKRILEKNIEAIQKKIDENMEFVYKFRAKAQTAARAQSKLKAAEEMQAEQREMKRRLEDVEGHAYKLHFRFRMMGAGPKFPVSMKDVSFKYAPETPFILKNVSLDVKRGQKVAIIGENGAGKTTLLNVIAERLKATEGYLVKGEGINEGYFGQHQLDELNLEESLLENLRVRAKGDSIEQLRGWLGAFGFPGEDATNKKAKVLSGGEKARLALLRILVAPANILLLDEPTNHLDVETKQILSRAIREYEGTVVMVSHDRDFLSSIAERIIHLSVDHQMTDHLGDLDSFFVKYPQWVRHIEGHKEPVAKKVEAKPQENAAPKLDYEERKKIKNTIRSLEKKIQAAEAEMATAGEHAKMSDWEKWSAELESLRTKYPDIK